MLVPIEIPSITQTAFVEVYPFNDEELNPSAPKGFVPVEEAQSTEAKEEQVQEGEVQDDLEEAEEV